MPKPIREISRVWTHARSHSSRCVSTFLRRTLDLTRPTHMDGRMSITHAPDMTRVYLKLGT